MKKKIKIITFLLMLLISITSCKKHENLYPNPVEISFTKYSLLGCHWTNFYFDGKFTVINSNEVLRGYIVCADNYPEIDFSKWTLLVFGAKHCNINSYVKKILLQQLSDNKYLLSVDIIPSDTMDAAPLIISILVPKISDSSEIELNVTIIQD